MRRPCPTQVREWEKCCEASRDGNMMWWVWHLWSGHIQDKQKSKVVLFRYQRDNLDFNKTFVLFLFSSSNIFFARAGVAEEKKSPFLTTLSTHRFLLWCKTKLWIDLSFPNRPIIIYNKVIMEHKEEANIPLFFCLFHPFSSHNSSFLCRWN